MSISRFFYRYCSRMLSSQQVGCCSIVFTDCTNASFYCRIFTALTVPLKALVESHPVMACSGGRTVQNGSSVSPLATSLMSISQFYRLCLCQRELSHHLIIIMIQAFVKRTMSANILNLRRRQSLGEEDGGSEV